MSIKVNLEKILIQEKVPFPVLIKKTGITKCNLSILKSNKAKLVRFSTLAAICMALNCQPGDILEYIPDTQAHEKNEINRSKGVRQL